MIYLILNTANSAYKIGHSADPVRRLASLQTGTSDKLELVAVLTGTRAQEKQLHEVFRKDRLSGEWFSHSDFLLQVFAKGFDDAAPYHDYKKPGTLSLSSVVRAVPLSDEQLEDIACTLMGAGPEAWIKFDSQARTHITSLLSHIAAYQQRVAAELSAALSKTPASEGGSGLVKMARWEERQERDEAIRRAAKKLGLTLPQSTEVF